MRAIPGLRRKMPLHLHLRDAIQKKTASEWRFEENAALTSRIFIRCWLYYYFA